MDKKLYLVIFILISCVLAVVLSFNDIIRNDYEYSDIELEVFEKANKKGFVIENGILLAYYGNKEEITVPKNVEIIGANAFASDLNRGINLKKVIVPGTVEELEGYAFSFSNAEEIILEDGVKKIGDRAFSDAYITTIHFPNSIEYIGFGVLDTTYGNNPEIICEHDSFACNHFENDPPYGSDKWNENN